MTLTHVAWDGLAVAQLVADLFGVPLTAIQKTTKTLCDRRVSLNSVNNNTPSCEICRKAAIDNEVRNCQIEADIIAWRNR